MDADWEQYQAAGEAALKEGDYPAAEVIWRAAYQKARSFKKYDARVSITLEGLAEALWHQGKFYEAEVLVKHTLEIFEVTRGPEHQDVAVVCNNLAMLLHFQGKYGEAEPMYKRALDTMSTILGSDHPDVIAILTNYSDLLRVIGRLAEADQMRNEALTHGNLTRSGQFQALETNTADNLLPATEAESDEQQSEFPWQMPPQTLPQHVPQSEQQFVQQSEEQFVQYAAPPVVPQPERQYMPQSVQKVVPQAEQQAMLYAEPPSVPPEEQQPMQQTVPPSVAPSQQQSMHYAIAPSAPPSQQQPMQPAVPPSAPPLAEQPMQQAVPPSVAPSQQQSMHYAIAPSAPPSEEQSMQQAGPPPAPLAEEQSMPQAVPPSAPQAAPQGAPPPVDDRWTQLRTQAMQAIEAGNFPAGESLWQEAIKEAQSFTGHDPRLPISLEGLAAAYWKQGKFDQAEALTKRCFNIYETVLGPDHDDVGVVANNLAMLYHAQGKLVLAEGMYKRSLPLRARSLGSQHPAVFNLMMNYCNVLVALDRAPEAEEVKARFSEAATGRWARSDSYGAAMRGEQPVDTSADNDLPVLGERK